MFHHKIDNLIALSGITYLILPHSKKEEEFLSEIKKFNYNRTLPELKNIFNFHYPGADIEAIQFFEKTLDFKTSSSKSKLNHALFIPSPNHTIRLYIQHEAKISIKTSCVVFIDSLLSVNCQSEGIVSVIFNQSIPENLKMRFLSAYVKSIDFLQKRADDWYL